MCRQKADGETKNFEAEAEERSEFVFSVSEGTMGHSSTTAFCWTNLEEAMGVDREKGHGLSTQEVVKRGFGDLDGGATKAMGSVHALQQIQSTCKEAGLPGVTRVDTDERPVFGFGNRSMHFNLLSQDAEWVPSLILAMTKPSSPRLTLRA